MHHRTLAPLAAALALVLAAAPGCASREKAGDQAAATGDWRTAEAQYADALRKDPGRPELQKKYQQARAAALGESIRKAKACWAGRDVECTYAESAYALRLDPGNAEMAALRAEASREAGLLRVRRAEDAAARGDLRGALTLLASAAEASQDPAVTGALRTAAPPVVSGAVAEADRRRSQAQFPAAIDLLGLAARVDPGVQPRLAAVQAEYERWKDGEAERLAIAGDQLLTQGRWAEAEQSYRQALGLRPRSRAEPLARYAGAMARGEAAVQRRDWPGAEKAYAEAAQLNVDRGQAAGMVDRVRVRPYAIALRSALVRPTRPDGWPWAGSRNREVDRLVAWLSRGNVTADDAMDLARRLPSANQPTLVVTLSLPDGRGVQSAPRRGAYALLDGSFTATTNGFDDRAISLRVVHDDGSGRPVDAGLVSVRLGEIVSAREVALANGALLALRVAAVPSDQPDGALDRLAPIPDRDNLAPAWSLPAHGAKGYRLAGVEAAPVATATGRGEPLWVEIVQGATVVYRSPPAQGSAGRWSPGTVFLFVRQEETLAVRLMMGRGATTRTVMSAPITGHGLDVLNVRMPGADGSTVTLRVEPRRSGPGAAPGT